MSNTTNKKPSPAIVIMKRELATYFTNPISYIVTGLFLIITGVMFFTTFFLQNRANMRNFFSLLPILFSFFIPALTMRLYSEEKKSGSIETLMTLPVTELQVVTGKFLAAFISSAIMLAPTLLYLVSILFFGKPDIGPIIGGYIGAIFLCAAFSAIGVFASSVTKNQLTAFFVAFMICIVLTMIDAFLIFLPAPIVSLLQFISANEHFTSISRGIIDTRDLIYFISLTALFFCLTVKTQENDRK
ncbi:MAG: ABC transporter permease subunit [Treponema sp.]|jgi:ABC-2 type transport system permease protein|nr:ABC transporter permease subunit [Treponema sp.]MBQ5646491.1 ABC transporter permease subunit [Treponema sp.]MBQ5847836.1 ABC transporter permease subunit [Treponema sp.]MBQ5877647.1 ABC transporter permease subunit [Treponema sp.]MEE1060007.1 ABC transporter permease subunit [Treponema sp.]